MRFTIPNQTRRNIAASRLRRDGFAVHAEPTQWSAPVHPLVVFGVESESDVESLVTTIAPGAVREDRSARG